MKRILCLLLWGLSFSGALAQASSKDNVIEEATAQLNALCSPAGDIGEYCVKNNIKGEFVMDFTVQGKGKILTIYMVSSTVEDVAFQNRLKVRLMEVQFQNIKLPKNERVKFRYTLTI
jgi:hypothetical protein